MSIFCTVELAADVERAEAELMVALGSGDVSPPRAFARARGGVSDLSRRASVVL
jgi:hypothetical protein